MKKTLWSINENIKKGLDVGPKGDKIVQSNTASIAASTNAMVKILRGKKSGQAGMVSQESDFAYIHGTSEKPEYLLPHDTIAGLVSDIKRKFDTRSGIPEAKSLVERTKIVDRRHIEIFFRNVFKFNNQVDQNFTKRYIENEVMPIMIRMFDSNKFLTIMQERLGVR
jgi:hypothetical protein